MNKILSSVLSLGSVAAFAFTLASCANGGSEKVTSSGSDTSQVASEAELKIAYVNTDTLLDQYEYFKEIRTTLEDKAKKAQSDLQSRSMAFQREVAEYQEKAATMSASDRQSTEERLARKQDELGRHQQNASASLAQDEADQNQKLYSKIAEYLKKHANEKGYKFVLSYSSLSSSVLFADESLDITTEVLTALNEEYKQETKK